MTGFIRRCVGLESIAALGLALAVPGLALAASSATTRVSTETSLTSELHDRDGRTTASLNVHVTGTDGVAAGGAVTIRDNGRSIAGAALDSEGHAALKLALAEGPHQLTATYAGDSAHSASVSTVAEVQAQAAAAADFQVAVSPATLSLTAGTSGSVVVSITPENSSSLTAPLFITLSCSGMPDESSCTPTPANVNIQPNATAPVTSSMVILTQAASSRVQSQLEQNASRPVSLAILLPGGLLLGGLAWSFRRKPWLQRLSLIGLVALVGLLGTTACNSRYKYFNHGPPPNPATPAGTYTIVIAAQSSNGVTATTHTTTLALTVK